MSRWQARVPADAVNRTRNPVDLAVLVVIALYANRHGASRIAVSQIAAETGTSPPTVKRSLRRLRASGALTVTPGTGRALSVYRLPVDNSVVGSLVTPQGGQRVNVVGSPATPITEEHSQRARSGAPVDNECPHGAPAGMPCIECRGARTA